jgi:hypothetical protein
MVVVVVMWLRKQNAPLLFLPARFPAHLVFGLAGRSRIIFHAGALLVGAHLAARLLSLRSFVCRAKAEQHQQRYRHSSHDENFLSALKKAPLRRSNAFAFDIVDFAP